ncbi:MAG TPA: molecular chaperone TorD family protein, partial [Paracoccaceae bacterium]|nr:molecular chaperone TorD family protein [Paracoccaceae bacterium]
MTQHASPASTGQARQDQEMMRAQHWAALGRLLSAAPDRAMLSALAAIARDETPMGRAWGDLAAKAATVTPEAVASEYFELFVGVGRGELLPYASFYLTGFLNERPLAELRRDLAVMGLEREAGRHDPEDHIASLCEIMAGLASGAFDADGLGCGGAGEAGFFARHIKPWAALFFQDLARAHSADFYRSLAAVGAAW